MKPDSKTPGRLLVVPSVEKNRGGGHLVRSASLVRSLRAAGREAYLFLPDFSEEASPRSLLEVAGLSGEPWILQGALQDPRNFQDPRNSWHGETQWDCIILDKFRADQREATSWSALAPLVGIDEGGPYRNNFDFLIDILPNLLKRAYNSPNIAAPSLIPLPHNRRPSFHKFESPLRVLISFGVEDTAGLGVQAALTMGRQARPGELAITLIAPGLSKDKVQYFKELPYGIVIQRGIPELREHLAEYDLLVTHFGLSAFEALYARLPVLLVSPGGYHEKLARHAGFRSVGIGPAAAARIGRFLPHADFLSSLAACGEDLAARYGLDIPAQKLGDILANLIPTVSRVCPACGAPFAIAGISETPARFPDRTYRRCNRCGMISLFRTSPPAIEYETGYFFDFYKSRYGKTYLEDFPNLIASGKKRLTVIKRFLRRRNRAGQTGGRLLDIGCAYGPFLKAAREEGFVPQGIDPAADAVRYVQEELGIPAHESFFPDISLESPENAGGFEVITLWYVVEHFEDLRWVLVEINRLLTLRGVLAFSTPSFSGISGKRSLRAFLEKSPPDHQTVWSPKLCRRILARYGFRLKKIRVTGHHPERFAGGERLKRGGLLWNLLLYISRIFRLGDTFECYAIKVRALW
jgi:2-polyprenyl-3-methyl-5-hydroxy-6-metoxy-1,4-benzoquinol methylase/spore coat polysaccharide biosynthesis predicted glycosyltransferase SpsG